MLQKLFDIGVGLGGKVVSAFWVENNLGGWLEEGWKYDFPGRWTEVSFRDYWTETVMGGYWYLGLDIPSYAPDLGPIAEPLMTRLNEFLDASQEEMDGEIHGPPVAFSRPKTSPFFVSSFGCLMIATMACVAEYPEAPPLRQAELSDLLAIVSKLVHENPWREVVAVIAIDGEAKDTELRGGTGIRPQLDGFQPTQAGSIERVLDWIFSHYPALLPDRAVKILPLPPDATENSGGTQIWSGDIELETAILSFADPDAKLVEVLTHELFHAKADSVLDRLYSKIRAKGVKGVPSILSQLVLDESEENFITAAGLAARAEFLGDDSVLARKLDFENGQPVLSRSDRQMRLPEWSPLVAEFATQGMGIPFPGPPPGF